MSENDDGHQNLYHRTELREKIWKKLESVTMWSCVVEFQQQNTGRVDKPVRQEMFDITFQIIRIIICNESFENVKKYLYNKTFFIL